METGFLPICRKDMEELGWDRPDFIYVSGDAYVDHPSFGHAIITRLLQAHGYKVCIIAQPDWKDKRSITEFIIPCQRSAGAQMHSPLAASWGNGRITLRWFTAT